MLILEPSDSYRANLLAHLRQDFPLARIQAAPDFTTAERLLQEPALPASMDSPRGRGQVLVVGWPEPDQELRRFLARLQEERVVLLTDDPTDPAHADLLDLGVADILPRTDTPFFHKLLARKLHSLYCQVRITWNADLLTQVRLATQPVIVTDLEDRILHVNDAVCDLTGYGMEELIGQSSYAMLLSPHEKARISGESLLSARAEGRSGLYTTEIQTKQGETVLIETSGTPLYDEAHQVIGTIGIITDLTRERLLQARAERQAGQLSTLLNSLGEGILMEDAQRCILHANKALAELFGLPEAALEEVAGQPCQTALQAMAPYFVDPTGFIEATDEAVRAGHNHCERLELADGRVLGRCYVPVVTEDELLGHLWQYEDITERLRASETIRSLARFPDENPTPVARLSLGGELLYLNRAARSLWERWEPNIPQSLPVLARWFCWGPELTKSRVMEVFGRFFLIDLISFPDAGYFNIYARDITEQKQAEAELVAAQNELMAANNSLQASEEELRQNAEMLAAMNRTLEERNQRLHEHDHEQHLVLTNLPMMVFNLDPDGYIRMIKGQGLASLQFTEDDMLGKHPHELFGYDSSVHRAVQRAMQGEAFREQVEINGAYFEHFFQPILDAEGEVCTIIGGAIDITNRVMAEAELRKARQIAEESVHTKQRFLANMSHEIRTPLNGIIGLAGLLTQTQASPKQREYLDALQYSADGLLFLVNQVLDISKLEAGKVQPQVKAFEPERLVRGLKRMLQHRLEQRRNAFTIRLPKECPRQVYGDPHLLHQVLSNLLDNANKFTEKGRIELQVSAQPAEDGGWQFLFEVTDNGAGIPHERQAAIFQSFEQSSPEIASTYGGSGLGLSIVHEMVQLQGGELQLESKPGEGSHFRVWLRYDEAPPVEQSPEESAGSEIELAGKRVLLVEDNSLNRLVAESTLSDVNVLVDGASDGYQALERLRSRRYDAILLDLRMPGLDGYETAWIIRQEFDEPTAITPILALSAHVLPEERSKCYELGMDAYLAKPYTREELFQALRGVLAEQEANESSSKPSKQEPALEDVDLSRLKAMLGEKPDVLAEVLQLTLAELDRFLAIDVAATDPVHVANAAHRLKTTVYHMSEDGLASALKALELAARQGEPGLDEGTQRLKDDLTKLRARVAGQLERVPVVGNSSQNDTI